MINKNILIGIFALALLFAFSGEAEAIVRFAGSTTATNFTISNATIIGGIDTGSTIRLAITSKVSLTGNWSLMGIFYNTSGSSLSSFTRLTVAGVAGNSSCSGRGCNHTGSGRGAMMVTITLPADTTMGQLRISQNISGVAGGGIGTQSNRTNISVSIDSTSPTFTLLPAEGFVYTAANKTVNVTVVTSENVSNIWIMMDGINHSNTLDVQGTNGLTRTGDTTWAFSYVKPSNGVLNYFARAYDYARDGANGATSSTRSFILNTGPSQRAKIAAFQQAQAAQGAVTTNVMLLIGIGVAIWYFGFRKGR